MAAAAAYTFIVLAVMHLWVRCASLRHARLLLLQGAPLNEADHCGDPPLILAAGNGRWRCPAGSHGR